MYNSANIARVKADEEAAAAREAAAEQRMQELDAERRAAILRGQTPPPLPEEETKDEHRRRDKDGKYDKRRRKLRGEDDTEMDIRLAVSMAKPKAGDEEDTKILKLRRPTSDAPLTDRAGNIDLFPVDVKEAIKREENAGAEKEKRKKERALEDQYTMRFANAAGKNGIGQPWYVAQRKVTGTAEEDTATLEYPGFESKNVWGNEDPRRKEREQARISSNDPFAFMQKAQAQLKRTKEDKKKWADERKHDLKELRDIQEKEQRRGKHYRRGRSDSKDDSCLSKRRSSKPSQRSRSRSRSPDSERRHRHSRRRDRSHSRNRDRYRRGEQDRYSSSRHHRSRSPSSQRR